MKEELTKFTQIDINDATFKMRLYINKITQQGGSHTTMEKTCHLAVESFLKFADSEQFTKENYEKLKALVIQKKSYYILYIIDLLLKNNKFVMNLARRDLELMFKTVWQKVNLESRNQTKLQNLKSMVKTWGTIFQKKMAIQQSIRKWLIEKYNTDLNLSEKSKFLFQQSYQKSKNSKGIKLQALLSQLSKQEPSKRSIDSSFDLARKIFED